MTTHEATVATLVDAGLIAASWDEETAEAAAHVLHATPIGTFSEDPLLTTRIANAYLRSAAGDPATCDDSTDITPGPPIHSVLARGMTLLKNEGLVLPLGSSIWPQPAHSDPLAPLATSLAFCFQKRLAVIDAASLAAREAPAEIEAAVRSASESVHAIVIIGPTAPLTPGDEVLDLAEQHRITARVAAAASRTIAVVTTSQSICLPWADEVDAILVSGATRPETAQAVAEILIGAIEPQGRTVVTYRRCHARSGAADGRPNRTVSVASYAWFYDAVSTPPLFWFGSGLGFGQWHYDDARLVSSEEHERLTVEIDLSNVGARDAVETIQIYFAPAELVDPVRLVGFGRVAIPAGGSASVCVECGPELLQSVPGPHADEWALRGELLVARGLGDVRLRVPLH